MKVKGKTDRKGKVKGREKDTKKKGRRRRKGAFRRRNYNAELAK